MSAPPAPPDAGDAGDAPPLPPFAELVSPAPPPSFDSAEEAAAAFAAGAAGAAPDAGAGAGAGAGALLDDESAPLLAGLFGDSPAAAPAPVEPQARGADRTETLVRELADRLWRDDESAAVSDFTNPPLVLSGRVSSLFPY